MLKGINHLALSVRLEKRSNHAKLETVAHLDCGNHCNFINSAITYSDERL